MLESNDGIKLGSTDGNVIRTILGYIDGITLELSVRIELDSLDGSFDGSKNGYLQELWIGGSLGSTHGKVLVYYECINLGSTDGRVIGTIPGNVDEITLGLAVGT